MFYFIFSGDVDPSEMEGGYKLSAEFLQRSPSHITIGKLTTTPFNTFPRQKQKDDCPDKTNIKCLFKAQDGETGKHDSDGSEEFYDAIDDESMLEQASTDKMEHPVTEKEAESGNTRRSPSNYPVGDVAISKRHYNTYPNLQKDFNEMKKENVVHVLPEKTYHVNVQTKDSLDEVEGIIGERMGFEKSYETSDQLESLNEMKISKMTDNSSDDVENLAGNSKESTKSHTSDDNNPELTESSVCMECVKAIPVCSKEQIKPGDHITFPGRIYDHHAIVVTVACVTKDQSDSEALIEIVHATNTSAKATLASLHPFGNKARLRQVNEIINLKERKVMVFKYSSDVKPFPSAEIVKRAIAEADADKAGGQGHFEYNLFRNNCEHFATWCVTGRKLSLQERKFTMVFWMFLKSGFYDISDEFVRNEKEYESGMLCKNCYSRNKRLLDVPKKKVMDANDITSGDIIIYSYYFLWHCAVVLGVLKIRKNYVKCQIAHYAYCGLMTHRTIVQEDLIIPLDGSVMVTVYPKKFNSYPPEEVVERARSRIGEQMFAFFTNDSSQFSRWCKLKLKKNTS